ncbi:MAG: DUF692 domain-containing protein [Deltaproteobacteria bacterium]|nr:DUF692 domain-containing protein [Deltaproteobacteria bacterium]
MAVAADRFGLVWRPELALGLLANLPRVGALEVMAENYFDASTSELRALRTLGRQVPLTLHGVSLGLASTLPVCARRLESVARLVGHLEPVSWSEHLAFVRAGGIEIGHLAAPPRNSATIEGTLRNLAVVRQVVGSLPELENIATLIEPPGSDRSEAEWTSHILQSSGCELLLDLHNLYANSVNFGFDARSFIKSISPESIAGIHLAGGRWIKPGRLLDDHLNDVPDEVFELLRFVGTIATLPLTVVIERDGHFPKMASLLRELDRARTALAAGRRTAQERMPHAHLTGV